MSQFLKKSTKKVKSQHISNAAQGDKKWATTEFTNLEHVTVAFNLTYDVDPSVWEGKHSWDNESLLEMKGFVKGHCISRLSCEVIEPHSCSISMTSHLL